MSDQLTGDTTLDAVLGGRLKLRQPRRGHRVGHDAILLAAATGGGYGERAVEFGSGVGAAGLAVAVRNPGMRLVLVEIDAGLCALATENAKLNGFADRVSALARDVTRPDLFGVDALAAGAADRVLMNPPFNDPARQNVSPDAARALAHAAPADALPYWVASAARALGTNGVLTLIWRADGLAQVLDALSSDFGDTVVLPVHPRPNAAAIRVLVRAVKGGRSPLALLPGLELNDTNGRPSAAAEEILRDGAVLPLATL
jgi:tRNA1(Val) A37 N6-methylase TrmN6